MRLIFFTVLFLCAFQSFADETWQKIDKQERRELLQDIKLEISGKYFECLGQTTGYKSNKHMFTSPNELMSTTLSYYISRVRKAERNISPDINGQPALRLSNPYMLIDGNKNSLQILVSYKNDTISKIRFHLTEHRQISEFTNLGTKKNPDYENIEASYKYTSHYVCDL